MSSAIIRVSHRQAVIVHLSNAISDDTEFVVEYSPNADVCDVKLFAPVRRNGGTLILSPKSTPLVLEFVGAYRLIKQSADSQALITTQVIEMESPQGDILYSPAYTNESV